MKNIYDIMLYMFKLFGKLVVSDADASQWNYTQKINLNIRNQSIKKTQIE